MTTNFSLLLFLFLSVCISTKKGSANKTLTVVNHCPYTVWPATYVNTNGILGLTFGASNDDVIIQETITYDGFTLTPGGTRQVAAPSTGTITIWGRTHCAFDDAGNGSCATGDYDGHLELDLAVTRAEFEFNPRNTDMYMVDMRRGYNLGIGVVPTGHSAGKGNCRYTGCLQRDMSAFCPPNMWSLHPVHAGSAVVACVYPDDCDYEDHLSVCTQYRDVSWDLCPAALDRFGDPDRRVCIGNLDYIITFCPVDRYSSFY